jgi:succinate dehydrogenase/fumarate reductase flavoprotein subunit
VIKGATRTGVTPVDDVDVVVVGSGAAGLAAAVTAAELGATVLVAEAEDVIGGSSRLSSGILMGAGTRFQRAANIDDSPKDLLREYLALNQWQVDAGLAGRLAIDSGPAIEWIADLGVRFHDTLSYAGEESRPRSHLPVDLGADVIEKLRQAAVARGVEIALRRRVDRLLVDGPAVVGVAVGEDELRSGSVVLASGGFGANPEKLRRWFPAPTEAGKWMWYIGAPGARGDALDLAEQVGAQVTGDGRGLCFLTPNFVHEYESTLPGWLLMVDSSGRRFCDETVAYGVLDRLVRARGGRTFVIFDEASRLAAPEGAPAAYRQSNPSFPGRRSPNWNDRMIGEMAGKGAVKTASTVSDLASLLGLPVDVTVESVRRYNELAAAGEDRDQLKLPQFLRPVATPPLYGAEMRAATVALTSVGLRIDVDAHVLSETGEVIPNLYAAGECTGGVLGDVYIGSGNSYSNCLVFGRAAGLSAAGCALVGRGVGAVAAKVPKVP